MAVRAYIATCVEKGMPHRPAIKDFDLLQSSHLLNSRGPPFFSVNITLFEEFFKIQLLKSLRSKSYMQHSRSCCINLRLEKN